MLFPVERAKLDGLGEALEEPAKVIAKDEFGRSMVDQGNVMVWRVKRSNAPIRQQARCDAENPAQISRAQVAPP